MRMEGTVSDDETWIKCPGCRESVQVIKKREPDDGGRFETICQEGGDVPVTVNSYLREHYIDLDRSILDPMSVRCPWSEADVAVSVRDW